MDLRTALRKLTKKQIVEFVSDLSDYEAELLLYDWHVWGRDSQLLPSGDWSTWLILAGRGYGKTRTGAETVKELVLGGKYRRIAIVAPTASDARDVMVEGESGLLNVFPPSKRPIYEPSKRRITFHNGAIATTYSADEPERLRGPQHDFAWCDELASWRYPEAYDMLELGLRLGEDRGVQPRKIITTTPKPTKLVKSVAKDSGTFITRGSTYDNAENLAQKFLNKIRAKYEGTRLGRQELYAEILDDNPGALWNRALIDANRCERDKFPQLRRIVVAIDPSATSGEESDETGIIVCGLGIDGIGYVLDDGSLRDKPIEWAKKAVSLYRERKADRIVAEVNNGGEMVEAVIRQVDANCSYRAVRASRGKQTRAEPISALYEQGRVKHVGEFAQLEEQMCEWDPINSNKSPDRMDALVWALTDLMVENNGDGVLDYYANKALASGDNSEKLAKAQEKLNEIFGKRNG